MWFHALEMEFSHYWDWDSVLGLGFCKISYSNSITRTEILNDSGTGI